jgi:hypothetical protein
MPPTTAMRGRVGALLLLGLPMVVPPGGGSVEKVMTGLVVEVEGDRWLSVVNERSGQPIRFTLRNELRVEGAHARRAASGTVPPGTLVAVSFRVVGERYFVATQLRLLDDAPTR